MVDRPRIALTNGERRQTLLAIASSAVLSAQADMARITEALETGGEGPPESDFRPRLSVRFPEGIDDEWFFHVAKLLLRRTWRFRRHTQLQGNTSQSAKFSKTALRKWSHFLTRYFHNVGDIFQPDDDDDDDGRPDPQGGAPRFREMDEAVNNMDDQDQPPGAAGAEDPLQQQQDGGVFDFIPADAQIPASQQEPRPAGFDFRADVPPTPDIPSAASTPAQPTPPTPIPVPRNAPVARRRRDPFPPPPPSPLTQADTPMLGGSSSPDILVPDTPDVSDDEIVPATPDDPNATPAASPPSSLPQTSDQEDATKIVEVTNALISSIARDPDSFSAARTAFHQTLTPPIQLSGQVRKFVQDKGYNADFLGALWQITSSPIIAPTTDQLKIAAEQLPNEDRKAIEKAIRDGALTAASPTLPGVRRTIQKDKPKKAISKEQRAVLMERLTKARAALARKKQAQ